jgi:hypothetical protein
MLTNVFFLQEMHMSTWILQHAQVNIKLVGSGPVTRSLIVFVLHGHILISKVEKHHQLVVKGIDCHGNGDQIYNCVVLCGYISPKFLEHTITEY